MSRAPVHSELPTPAAIEQLTRAIDRLSAQLAKPRPRRLSRRLEALRIYAANASEPESMQ
jgi:hypothetical protein